MNKIISGVISLFALSSSLFASQLKIVIPKHDDVSVYLNMPRALNERPVFRVNTSDHLKILDDNECCFFVIDTKGRKGWVEKNNCSRNLSGKSISFDAATVESSNDLFSPPFIFGVPETDMSEIRLSRSFRENLKDNVDKEDILRITGGSRGLN